MEDIIIKQEDQTIWYENDELIKGYLESSKKLSKKNAVSPEEKLSLFATTPMLIAWGGKDFCFNDHFYTQWQQRFPQAACHYFKNAGHYVLEDAFEEIGPLVADFLAENVK